MPSCPRTPVCLLPPRGENTTRTLSQLHGMIYGARQEEETLGSTELHRAAPSRTEPLASYQPAARGWRSWYPVIPQQSSVKQPAQSSPRKAARAREALLPACRAPRTSCRSFALCAALRSAAFRSKLTRPRPTVVSHIASHVALSVALYVAVSHLQYITCCIM